MIGQRISSVCRRIISQGLLDACMKGPGETLVSRRSILCLAGTGMAGGLAGCLGGNEGASSSGIASTDFTVSDETPELTREDDPVVSFEPSANRLEVTGVMAAGNPCTVATLRSTTLREDVSELDVTIGTKPTGDLLKRVLGCPDSLRIVGYTATITLEDGLPGRVTVTEMPVPGRHEGTVTVRRDTIK